MNLDIVLDFEGLSAVEFYVLDINFGEFERVLKIMARILGDLVVRVEV